MVDIGGFTLNLWYSISLVALFSFLYFYSYRRYIVSIFDPLNVFLISQIAACILALLLIEQPIMLAQFFTAQVAFYLGFRMTRTPRHKLCTLHWTGRELQEAEWIVGLLFLGLLAANFYLGLTSGFPLLSGNPSLAKTEVYTGGLGIVKRLNGGLGVFVPAGSLILALKGNHKKLFAAVLVACMAILSLGGGKGALLSFLYIFAYALYRRDLVPPANAARLSKLAKWTAVLALALSLFVISATASDLLMVFGLLAKRILFFGDVIIYYYHPDVIRYFSNLDFGDFLSAIANPIIGAFRLVPYQKPLGYLMVLQQLGNNETLASVLGPNDQFYVLSNIYFGFIFGPLYCAFVGYSVSKVRSWYFSAGRVTPLQLTCLLTLGILIFTFPMEAPLFASQLFDTFVPVGIACALVFASCSAARYGAGLYLSSEARMRNNA